MSPRIEAALPRSPEAVARARRLLERELRDHLSDNAAGNLKIVVSELITNAIRHGSGAITLSAQLCGDVVRVEVTDQGTGEARTVEPQPADLTTPGGFGLRTVDVLARDWGAYEGSTHVWAEVSVR